MKSIPYNLCPYQTAGRFAVIEDPEIQLQFILNLFSYSKNGVISVNALYKLSTMIQLQERAVLITMRKQPDVESLVKYCSKINDIYKLGFFDLNFIRFLNDEANIQFKMLTTKFSVVVVRPNNNYSTKKSN